jgi:hypothetical protein
VEALHSVSWCFVQVCTTLQTGRSGRGARLVLLKLALRPLQTRPRRTLIHRASSFGRLCALLAITSRIIKVDVQMIARKENMRNLSAYT